MCMKNLVHTPWTVVYAYYYPYLPYPRKTTPTSTNPSPKRTAKSPQSNFQVRKAAPQYKRQGKHIPRVAPRATKNGFSTLCWSCLILSPLQKNPARPLFLPSLHCLSTSRSPLTEQTPTPFFGSFAPTQTLPHYSKPISSLSTRAKHPHPHLAPTPPLKTRPSNKNPPSQIHTRPISLEISNQIDISFLITSATVSNSALPARLITELGIGVVWMWTAAFVCLVREQGCGAGDAMDLRENGGVVVVGEWW